MKCLSVRVIAPSLLLVGTVLSPVLAWSMDEMTDSQLSTTTGQDGITVLVAPPTLTAAQKSVAGQPVLTQTNGLIVGAAILHDKDGFTGYTSAGALVFGDAKQANVANAVGIQSGVYASAPIKITMDSSNGKVATGLGGTLPVLNVNLALPSDLLIRTGDISLDVSSRSGIAVGAAGATKANAAIGGTTGKAVKIINSMDIAFGGTAISLNLQLGHTPQGGMISFGTLNIPSITFSGLSLASPNGGVSPSQLAMTPLVTNLDLTGAKIDAVQDMGLALGASSTGVGGLIFSDSSLTVGSLQLNNVIAGTSGAVSATVVTPGSTFTNGMANASLGSFGITNLAVTNLRIGVSGM